MDHSENTLRAVEKALTDVVAPAVDPKDALAAEQLRLVVDFVRFLRGRLEWLDARVRAACGTHLATARALRVFGPLVAPDVRAALEAATEQAEALPADADQRRVGAATAALAGAIRRLVRAAQDIAPDARSRIERATLEGAEPIIAFERAWYLPQGFDAAPSDVPPLESFLRPT